MMACSNIYPGIIQKWNAYRREGALSQYLAEFEVLWLLFSWLGSLDSRLCAVI